MDSRRPTNLSRTVLIVDDHEMNARLIEEVLKREGYTVRVSGNGLEALDVLNLWSANLILLDQDMPGLTGVETLERIKLLGLDSDIMFVSAHSNAEMVKRCLEMGADDFLKKPFSLTELVSRVKVRFRIRDLREQLEEANRRLQGISERDDLTGLFNMRAMNHYLEIELDRARRKETQVGCVMLDMDHFKRVNDDNDHLFGSFVIKEVGRILKNSIRSVDYAARYGGDEFMLTIVEATPYGMKTVCERIRETIASVPFTDGRSSISLTASIGYSISPLDALLEPSELIRSADHALYEAKDNGRNQVRGWDSDVVLNHILEFRKRRKVG